MELVALSSMYSDELQVIPPEGDREEPASGEEVPAAIRAHCDELASAGNGGARTLRLRLTPRRDEPCYVEVDLWISLGPSYPTGKDSLRLCARPVKGLTDEVHPATSTPCADRVLMRCEPRWVDAQPQNLGITEEMGRLIPSVRMANTWSGKQVATLKT